MVMPGALVFVTSAFVLVDDGAVLIMMMMFTDTHRRGRVRQIVGIPGGRRRSHPDSREDAETESQEKADFPQHSGRLRCWTGPGQAALTGSTVPSNSPQPP